MPIKSIRKYHLWNSFWLTRVYCPIKKGTMHCDDNSVREFRSRSKNTSSPGQKKIMNVAVVRMPIIVWSVRANRADKQTSKVKSTLVLKLIIQGSQMYPPKGRNAARPPHTPKNMMP